VIRVAWIGELQMSDQTQSRDHKGSTSVNAGSSVSSQSGSQGEKIGCANEVLDLLSRVIQRDIVPNLITANRVIGDQGVGGTTEEADAAWHHGGFNLERGERDIRFTSNHIRMADVARFVRLLRATGTDAAPAFIEVLLARGISHNELYLDLLGPAARMIGDMWRDDECSFAEVTMVVSRLHQILHGLRSGRIGEVEVRTAPTALMVLAPGEQHSFGLAIACAFFEEAGWQTRQLHDNDAEAIIDAVANTHFDLVGFSLSSEAHADVLRATIMRMRAASANPDVVVIVGGPAFETAPELVSRLGADALGQPGCAGALKAQNLLPRHLGLSV
jgi:methanogenic corrinoid protein MtbC1